MSVLPYRLIGATEAAPQLSWLATDGDRYTEPFFQETLARLRRLPVNRDPLPLTPVGELAAVSGPPPTAIIFHVSRCGSTLVAQMLASLAHHTVLAEPPLVDEVLRLTRDRPAAKDAASLALVRGTVAALARPHAATSRRLFVKADPWHLFEVPRLRRAFPGVPFVLLHRHPVEVLVSLLRRPSLALVHDTVTPEQLGLTHAERDRLDFTDHAAAVVGAFFRAANEHRREFTVVDYTQLPAWVADAFPGCSFTAEERAALAVAATRDAKNPESTFTADSARKRAEAPANLLAAAERWALPPYRVFLAASAAAGHPAPL